MSEIIKPDYVIAWLDHQDHKFDVINELKTLNRVKNGYMQPLGQCCEFINIDVPLNDVSEMVNYVIDSFQKNSSRVPDIFFVDLNFGDTRIINNNKTAGDIGIEFAQELSKRVSPAPVGLFTFINTDDFLKVKTTVLGFPILLQDFNNLVYGKMNGNQWCEIFDLLLDESKKRSRDSLNFLFTENQQVVWKDGKPLYRSYSFQKAAPHLVARTLKWLDSTPSEITISQLSGGFSGAFVVKAEVTDRNLSFVIKIDENPESIKKELEGYRKFKSYVDPRYYLQLMNPNQYEPEKLTDNWWGAFAMQYDGESKPLINCYDIDSTSLATIYERLWTNCLFSLYRNCSEATISIGKIITENLIESIEDGWKSIERYQNRFKNDYYSFYPEIDSLKEKLKTLISLDMKLLLVDMVHGDLNCRNILYESKTDTFRLIDFPHVGEKNCLAFDFVKAECELILIMMDWATGKDCDFNRIPIWAELLELTSNGLNVIGNDVDDMEINRILIAIRKIREIFTEKAGNFVDLGRSYQIYLLARLLKYVTYNDITTPKRFLIYIWIQNILKFEW